MNDPYIAPNFFFERVLTKISNLDVAGYVFSSFPTLEGIGAVERLAFAPEDLLIALERLVIDKYGAKGKRDLYGIGKRSGYNFMDVLGLAKNEPSYLIDLISRFLSTTYGMISVEKIDVAGRMYALHTKNLVITAKSGGGGYILTVGGAAGIWAYLLSDYSVECCASSIGDAEYRLVCAEPERLRQMGIGEVIEASDNGEYGIEIDKRRYAAFNTPEKALSQPPPAFTVNIKKLMEAGILRYSNGMMFLGVSQARLFTVEISLFYEIERYIDGELVYNAAYSTFCELGRLMRMGMEWHIAIAQLLTSFGMGLVTPIRTGDRMQFAFRGYPWLSDASAKSSFAIMKGAICGFGFGSTERAIEVLNSACSAVNNVFVITIETSL